LAALARLLHDGGTKLGAELHQLAVLAVDPHFDEVSAIGDDLIHFVAILFRRLRLRAGDKGGGHEAVLYGENPRAAEIAALLLRLEISDVVGIETHVVRGGDAIEGVWAQLGVALRIALPQLSREETYHRSSARFNGNRYGFGTLDENLNAGANGQRRQAC